MPRQLGSSADLVCCQTSEPASCCFVASAPGIRSVHAGKGFSTFCSSCSATTPIAAFAVVVEPINVSVPDSALRSRMSFPAIESSLLSEAGASVLCEVCDRTRSWRIRAGLPRHRSRRPLSRRHQFEAKKNRIVCDPAAGAAPHWRGLRICCRWNRGTARSNRRARP